jgi:hypothetical protein
MACIQATTRSVWKFSKNCIISFMKSPIGPMLISLEPIAGQYKSFRLPAQGKAGGRRGAA